MLRINNRRFKRSYVYRGTDIFDFIANVAASFLPVGKEVVQNGALEVGKNVGRKRCTKAIISHI